MHTQEQGVTLLLGLASLGIGVVALLSAELRLQAIIVLLGFLVILSFHLQLQRQSRRTNEFFQLRDEVRAVIEGIRRDLDLHKKLFKLEEQLASLKKMRRKGRLEPIWIAVSVVLLVFLYFLLKATGVL